MFFPKSDFQKKRPLPGCWSQSYGVGMHQNPHFQFSPPAVAVFSSVNFGIYPKYRIHLFQWFMAIITFEAAA